MGIKEKTFYPFNQFSLYIVNVKTESLMTQHNKKFFIISLSVEGNDFLVLFGRN